MSVELRLKTEVTAVETLEDDSLDAGSNSVRHTAWNQSVKLNGDTDVPVTKVAAFEKALIAGAATIDLMALTGTNGADVDGTGLKVQAIKLIADADNTAFVEIKEGASNGYELLGDSWTMDLQAGQQVTIYGNDAAPDIGAAAKDIDLASTHLTAKVQVIVVMG